MKFRIVFVLFNVFLVLFLAVLCVSPALFLGSGFASTFWRANWILIVLAAAVLVAFDSYFIINRNLYILLEKEDWPALVHYLEEKVLRQGKFSPHLVRLLANTYLVLSDSPSVMSLENKAAIAKPSLVDDNVLLFGTARILGRDISGAVRFFETRKAGAKPALRPWIKWYHGFSLLLDKQYENAAQELIPLARQSPNGIVAGLSAFFLADSIAKAMPEKAGEFAAAAADGKERVKKAFPKRKDWARETGRLSTEIYAAAITKYMGEAASWVYAA